MSDDLTPDSAVVRLYAALEQISVEDAMTNLDLYYHEHAVASFSAEHERLCSERIAAAEKAARVKALEEALSAANVEMEDWRIHGFSHETLGAKSVRDRIRAIITDAEAQPGTKPDHG